jgi:DNA topoisomerase-1
MFDGRYGPYVSDGTTNASVPKGVDPASLTLETAVTLLREREGVAPKKRPTRRGATGRGRKPA